MSLIREVEDKINVYSPVRPFSEIVNEVFRPNDFPQDAILYGEVLSAMANYYMRVAEAKRYDADMKLMSDGPETTGD